MKYKQKSQDGYQTERYTMSEYVYKKGTGWIISNGIPVQDYEGHNWLLYPEPPEHGDSYLIIRKKNHKDDPYSPIGIENALSNVRKWYTSDLKSTWVDLEFSEYYSYYKVVFCD